MNATAKNTDPMRIKWRGHPTEQQCEGRATALRYAVSVHSFAHIGGKGEFGIYYGGTLKETFKSPVEKDDAGKPVTRIGRKGKPVISYDYIEGYKLAKERAQVLVATFLAEDKAHDAKRAAEETAAAEKRAAEDKADEERAANKAEALALAAEIEATKDQLCDSDGAVIEEREPTTIDAKTAKRLAALVKTLLAKGE